MQQVFKNNFIEINQDAAQKYGEIIYLEATAEMSEEEYMATVQAVVEFFDRWLNSSINRILFDTRKNFYPIAPELQLWTVEQFERFKEFSYKTATLLSHDFITSLSIEQSNDEFDVAGKKIENRIFEYPEQAKQWLLS
jgi:hypothetical protein